MLKKNRTKIILLLILLLLLVRVFIVLNKYKKNIHGSQQETINTNGQTTLEINGIKYTDSITQNESVYNFMEALQNKGKISFKTTTYTGMGKFVEEINGLKSNGEKYWIYYVNNKKANIGVSNYKLSPGDIIAWKYENNTY